MIRAIIPKENINDDLLLKPIFAMTYVKNNQLTRAIQNLSLYKAYSHKLLNISYLQIRDSTVYIFLHKEKQRLKLEKWTPKALKKYQQAIIVI